MKKRILAMTLVLVLALGLFAGCSKNSGKADPAQPGSKDQPSSETKYAYQPTYIPLDLGEEQIQWVNGFCVGENQLYLLGNCIVGEKPYDGEDFGYYETVGAMDDIAVAEPAESEAEEPAEPQEPMMVPVYEMGLFRIDLDTNAVTKLASFGKPELPEGYEGDRNVTGMRIAGDGTIWVTEQIYSYYFDLPENFDPETQDKYMYYMDGGTTTTMRHFGADGQELNSIQLEVPQDASLYNIMVLDDGTICGWDWRGIYLFDSQGKSKGMIELENVNTVISADGKTLQASAWKEDGNYLMPLDLQTLTTGEAVKLNTNAYDIYPGINGYDYLYQSNGAIYGCKGTDEPAKLFSWLDCDVDSGNLNGYQIQADGTVYALEGIYDGDSDKAAYSLIVLKQVDASTLPQRQELTLACLYLDWDLRTEIINFNKSQDQVRIVVKDYSQYATEEDYNAGLQKLNTEILSGMVPDLFAVDSNLPLASYGSKGILTDLWTLIDADPELSRDDLMTHLFDVMSLDGKLYQIVDTFSINTVAGRTDRIGTADSWTVAELMDVWDSLPEDATVCGGMDTKNDMMITCVYRNIDSFVDWANLQCRFDSQEFIDLLTFVNSFPQEFDYENFDWDAYGSDYDRLASGKQMLLYTYLSSFNDVQRMDAITDGKPNYIGYPTTEGSGSSFQVYGGLAISASCKNMDAAWSFVRRFLTEDYQTKEYMWEFPTNRHAFENYAKQRMTPQYTEDPETGEQVKQPQDWYWVNDDLTIEIYEMTQEEYDRFMAVYEKTDRMNSYNQAISDIIGQECEAFFAGQKTAEETAKLIQNRVNLYIYEQG